MPKASLSPTRRLVALFLELPTTDRAAVLDALKAVQAYVPLPAPAVAPVMTRRRGPNKPKVSTAVPAASQQTAQQGFVPRKSRSTPPPAPDSVGD